MGRLYYQSTFPIKDVGIVFQLSIYYWNGFEYIIIFCFAGYSLKYMRIPKILKKLMRQKCFE